MKLNFLSPIHSSVAIICAALVLSACSTTTPVKRYAWVTGLKREKAARYAELHAHPWPAVNRRIKESNIRNFSIYEKEIGGELYLFAYLEYTGRDFAADMKKMGEDPETIRWWKETDPCQRPLPEAKAKKKIWSDACEVYHLD